MLSMTVTELRDRLDDRFRLLVGSRRGLERHQTLRHAVQWSYDLLDDAEKALLTRCSVFAGGFDLAGACAVAGSGDEYATLDLLDSLVRKSLVVADRSSERTRFSMLETIRQFAEEQLVANGEADEVAHAHTHVTSPDAKPTCSPCGTARDSARPTTGSPSNWPTCAPRSAGPPTTTTSTPPRPSPSTTAFLGYWIEQYEPVAWAEELIEPARAVDHPRLAQLYVDGGRSATRPDESTTPSAMPKRPAGHRKRTFRRGPVSTSKLRSGGPYIWKGVPDRWLEWCRNMIAQGGGTTHRYAQAYLVMALTFTGADRRGHGGVRGPGGRCRRHRQPAAICFALARVRLRLPRRSIPSPRTTRYRRGLTIAQDSGNRQIESHLAREPVERCGHSRRPGGRPRLPGLGDPQPLRLGQLLLLLQPAGNPRHVSSTGSGHYEAAATISGFADTPFTRRRPTPRSTPRSRICAKCSVTRPTNRSPGGKT